MCYIHTKGKTFHVSTSVRGLAAMSDHQLDEMAPNIIVDGQRLRTAAQVRSLLDEVLAEGFEYIPSEGCDNYDSRGLCQGHKRIGGIVHDKGAV